MDSIRKCGGCGADIPNLIRNYPSPPHKYCSKDCYRTYRKQYLKEWKAANRERKAASDAAHRRRLKETHPDYFREFYAKNNERRKQESLAWYHANRDRATAKNLECLKRRRAERPEHVRALVLQAAHRYAARKRQTFVEDVDPRVVFERDKGICGICTLPVDRASRWEIDHVMPVSKGGEHSYANTQLAHRKCNRAKWATVPPLVIRLCPSP